MSDFDRAAVTEALELLDHAGTSGVVGVFGAMTAITEAARWAVQITEGDRELWAAHPCQHDARTPHSLPHLFDGCEGGSHKRVWPPEAGE